MKVSCENCGHEFKPRSNGHICPKCKHKLESKIKVNTLQCAKCKKEWAPRVSSPALCPGCRTPYWKKENRTKKGEIVHHA